MRSLERLIFFTCLTFARGEFGEKIGDLTSRSHAVSGTVYKIDNEKLLIHDFNFDGDADDTFFYVGVDSHVPNKNGIQIAYPSGVFNQLERFRNADVYLTLPSGLSVYDIKYLSVWNRQFEEDFGHVALYKGHGKGSQLTPSLMTSFFLGLTITALLHH